MKKTVVLLSILSLAACNTVRGFGEDIGLAGKTLVNTTDKVAGRDQDQPAAAPRQAPAPVMMNDKDTVRHVQQSLRDQKLYNGPIDGIIGVRTHRALNDYQRAKGLPTSGDIDEATLNAINGTTPNNQNGGQPTPPDDDNR